MNSDEHDLLPSFGDLAATQMTISRSTFPVLVCEGISDRDNAFRIHGSNDGLLVIVSDQIQGEGSARKKVEQALIGISDHVAGAADSDICIDSLLSYDDNRIDQPNLFYSDGYTLENYILIHWNEMQGYFDPANTEWPYTLENTDQYFKSFSIWSVFVRNLSMRDHRAHGYSKEKICKQIMGNPIEQLLKVSNENIELNNVKAYTANISESEYIDCLEKARNDVRNINDVQHGYLVDKWFVPYIIHKLLDNTNIKKHKNRKHEELCDSCLSHLMLINNEHVKVHLAKALKWLEGRQRVDDLIS